MAVKLSIVILNWNTRELLKNCLLSVTGYQLPATEIIVVDNASADDSVTMIKKDFPKVKLIQNEANIGFAKGNNCGIKAAQGEYIMLLNTDTIVKNGALKKLVDFLDKNPEFDMVGPCLLNSDGSFQANCGRFPDLSVVLVMLFKEHWGGSDFVRRSPLNSCQVDWLMGAAFVARRGVYDKIGALDERIFMYMEEVEWFYRARQAGFKAYFLKEAEIIHLGRGSSTSGKKEPIINIYRGLTYYYQKHGSFLEKAILKILLKIKAMLAIFYGYLRDSQYLKETYGQAFKNC